MQRERLSSRTSLSRALALATEAGQWELASKIASQLEQLEPPRKPKQGDTDPCPAPPPPSAPRPKPRDILAEMFSGMLPWQREDVRKVFREWARVSGQKHARLMPRDVRAEQISDALEVHNVEWCFQVLDAASRDPMVLGKADKDGLAHWSIAYIFRPDVADRLHGAWEARQAALAKRAKEIVPAEQESAEGEPIEAADIEALLRRL